VKGFPAVKKTYLANTAAIFVVLADERWKIAFPNATTAERAKEYRENNERILLASIGAVVQNIQLAVTALGFTSAWLSGGGEDTTNRDLQKLFGFPAELRAVGTNSSWRPGKRPGFTLSPSGRTNNALESLRARQVPTKRDDRLLRVGRSPVRDVPRR
jgi:nitroreductase